MEKIAFLIAYETSPYTGVVRPFTNWAKALNDDALIIIYNCSSMLESHVIDDSVLNGFKVIKCQNIRTLVRNLQHHNIEYLISDDFMPRLKLLLKIGQEIKVKCVTYVQVLNGIHALVRNYSKELSGLKSRIIFSSASSVPFRLVSYRYRTLLKRTNAVIVNGKLLSGILNLIYGIEPKGIVYPPVDTNTFKPANCKKNNKEIAIYLGSNAGDTNPRLVQKLAKKLIDFGCHINAFGNGMIYEKYLRQMSNIFYYNNLSDDAITEIYSKAYLTIAPQIIEFFGLVPVESLACGTPVLTRYPHEALSDESTGQISCSDDDLLEKAILLLSDYKDKYDIDRCREVAMQFSIEKSKISLVGILKSLNDDSQRYVSSLKSSSSTLSLTQKDHK